MQKNMRAVVSELQALGHDVEYYVRSDGGILIRKIDGNKFSGASGNIQARRLTGEELSVRRAMQLTRATEKRAKYKGMNIPTIPDYYKKELAKVQRHWRKKVDVSKTGQPTLAKLRWRLINEGEESAKRLLGEWEKYTQGIAYTEVVKALHDYIVEFNNDDNNPELDKLAEDIWANRDNIRDEWILPAYQALYKLNNGQPVEDVINNVRAILRLA